MNSEIEEIKEIKERNARDARFIEKGAYTNSQDRQRVADIDKLLTALAESRQELKEWRESDSAVNLKRHLDELASERERRTVAQEACVELNRRLSEARAEIDRLTTCAVCSRPAHIPYCERHGR